MLQARGKPDLALKALGTQSMSQVRMQHLEGDGSVVAEVVREIHGCHPAVAELAADGVTRGEARLQLLPQVGHGLPFMYGKGCTVWKWSVLRKGKPRAERTTGTGCTALLPCPRSGG